MTLRELFAVQWTASVRVLAPDDGIKYKQVWRGNATNIHELPVEISEMEISNCSVVNTDDPEYKHIGELFVYAK